MKGLLISLFLSVSFLAVSQTCTVLIAGLKGAYEGECKKNKADGNGTATGEDNYTGKFKNGYPQGNVKYPVVLSLPQIKKYSECYPKFSTSDRP